MLSDGVLRCAVRENVGGKLRTSYYEKKGPIACVESTSAATIFPEDENRCLVFHVDESQEQTREILRAVGEAAVSGGVNVYPIAIFTTHCSACLAL